jgi:hypothetical protein
MMRPTEVWGALMGKICGLEQAFTESLQRTHDNNRSLEKKRKKSPQI